jgi:ATP-dependent exoDNAse (exonuclease V) beta subunit
LKKSDCSPQDYEEIKTGSLQLLAHLTTLPEFLKALLRVKNLPSPHYDSEQWEVLQALFTLLPLLVGHLQLRFNEHNEVDFSSISQQALLALGEEENPTDLALYLDNTIHHLLVDEFQDTSIQQFQLLTQLVQSFQPHDGKTLFVVGDPMQSIYRFRSAEVGLFLKAQQQGIGPVTLIPLELTCNFRSSATIVQWVNEQFEGIFPEVEDIESGAIRFHPSTPIHPTDGQNGVMAFAYEDRPQEAQALVLRVESELEAYPLDDIAILVRSRTQLTDIMRLLREHKIPFQGIEIDPLAKLPHLRDVWSLTQALLMPSNRLTWLTVLRSPWCGLGLADILSIATHAKHKSIYFALSQLQQIQGLTDEGRTRATYIYNVLDKALVNRHRQSLTEWIMDTLNALHFEQVLDTAQQQDLDQFWLLLDRFERQGYIENLALFNDEFNKLYSKRVTPARLKIMTIHKSKGLEFDCVMLPGLGSKSLSIDTPLLRWLKVPSQDHENRLLLSPMKAAYHDHCLLYNHLGKLDAEKNAYELQRLLYVAVTRAKKRLYLFDSSTKVNQDTCRALLQKQSFVTEEKEPTILDETPSLPSLHRLPLDYYHPHPILPLPSNPITKLTLTDNRQRLTGIVVHELLQWICDYHPETSADIPWELTTHSLRALGFETQALHDTLYGLKTQLDSFFKDPIGAWLIKRHQDEQNEYELLVENERILTTRIIDRTFVEHGIRWIIDFKTGHDEAPAQAHHHEQLSEYARLFTHLGQEPIRCGVYYLASNQWVAWEHHN